jgi:hypothetical protein
MTAITVAIKFFEDHFYDNVYYAKIGGIVCRDLNQLEAELLERLAYDLNVQPECYQRYLLELLPSKQPSCAAEMDSETAAAYDPKSTGGIPQVLSAASIKTVSSCNDLPHDDSP